MAIKTYHHLKNIIAHTKFLWILGGTLIFYLLLYKIYMPHTNSFGCFDECMNYGGGYFMLHGKTLYSQIFFNHQPIMAYLSALIQFATHPQSIYELIYRHTQFLFLFSFSFAVLIAQRFRLAGVVFIVVYELSKFYLFGNRFLAEALIVYPMVYLAGLAIYKIQQKPIKTRDYLLAGVFTWFCVFNREPYILAVLFTYLVIIGKPSIRSKQISLMIFIVLTILQLAILPLKDYWFSIWTVSYQGTLHHEVAGIHVFGSGILQIFFYPIYLLWGGAWNEFRILLTGLSALFLFLSVYYLAKRQYILIGFIYLLLGLANIRVVNPGEIFYAAFHMLPWFALLIFISSHLILELRKSAPKLSLVLGATYMLVFVAYLLQPQTFFKHPVNTQDEFVINFGPTYQIGEIIKTLSVPSQTVFLDGEDGYDLAYIQAQRYSSYQYSWYEYFALGIEPYKGARLAMFQSSPPDFYVGPTPQQSGERIPAKSASQYQELTMNGQPSLVYVKKSVLTTISQDQWKRVQSYGIDMPKTE